MTLEEYIAQINAELSLGIEDEVDKCKRYIFSEARLEATNNCACVDNETVKEWIIYYAENKPEGYEEEVKCVAEEPKKEPVRKKEKKEEKQNESVQLSLFGI